MDRDLLRDLLDWDIDAWSVPLRYWDERVDFGALQSCLDLGAGWGGLSLWLALKGKRVLCTDKDARWRPMQVELHERHGVGSLVRYEALDATSPLPEAAFDLIVAKSFLGNFGAFTRPGVLRNLRNALRPGGLFLFAENLAATPLHRLGRAISRGNRRAWCYPEPRELSLALREIGEVEMRCSGLLAPFGRSERQRSALSRLDGWLDGVTPSSWKYIGYGVVQR